VPSSPTQQLRAAVAFGSAPPLEIERLHAGR
jgi:hypothetical protein